MEEKIKKAIKVIYNRHKFAAFDNFIRSAGSDHVAVRYAPTTVDIANYLGMKTSGAKRELEKMMRRGLLIKERDHGVCRWWIIGLVEEMNNEA